MSIRVLYRHTGTGETVFAQPGEQLPERSDTGLWLSFVHDNVEAKACISVLVGRGVVHVISMADFPSVGDDINIMPTHPGIFPSGIGEYRVTGTDWARFRDQELPRIFVQRVGDIDESRFVHLTTPATC